MSRAYRDKSGHYTACAITQSDIFNKELKPLIEAAIDRGLTPEEVTWLILEETQSIIRQRYIKQQMEAHSRASN